MCALKWLLNSRLAKEGSITLCVTPTSESGESLLLLAQMDARQSSGRGLLNGGGGDSVGASRLKVLRQTDERKQDVVGRGGDVTA